MTKARSSRGKSANKNIGKQKKLHKELNHSSVLNAELIINKIDLTILKPLIELKVKGILDIDDEILLSSISEHLADKNHEGKKLPKLVANFVEGGARASKFMQELRTKLIETQQSSNGLSLKNASASPGNGVPTPTDGPETDLKVSETKEDTGERKSRSRSRTPMPKRADSKSHSRSNSRSGSEYDTDEGDYERIVYNNLRDKFEKDLEIYGENFDRMIDLEQGLSNSGWLTRLFSRKAVKELFELKSLEKHLDYILDTFPENLRVKIFHERHERESSESSRDDD